MATQENFEKVHFDSLDGLLMTADLYETPNAKGMMVLCHRSHFSRREYRETAPKFQQLGFSCLAIDQRSGMTTMGVVNETKTRAKEQGLPMGFVEAQQDVEAAVNYAFEHNNHQPIILVGSSYSASLALLIAATSEKVKAVLAFSPGEYLKKIKVAEAIRNLDKPAFVTSDQKEVQDVTDLLSQISSKSLVHYKPTVTGVHGSKTLWESVKGHETYWEAVAGFLERYVRS